MLFTLAQEASSDGSGLVSVLFLIGIVVFWAKVKGGPRPPKTYRYNSNGQRIYRRPASTANALYLIYNPAWGAGKIGVSSNVNYRLWKHREQGWRVYRVWHVAPGQAYPIEQAMLGWIRRHYTRQIGCPREAMPQGGSSETWPLSVLSMQHAAAVIDHNYFQPAPTPAKPPTIESELSNEVRLQALKAWLDERKTA